MYYTELGMRDVFLMTDDQGNFHIRGELTGGGASTTIELCQIFLEYAMNCYTWCSWRESLHSMRDFAQCMGSSTGKYLQDNTDLFLCDNPIDRVLEHLFQTMNAHISIKYSGTIEHLTVLDCPLEKTAASSGLRNVELAHYGINLMCQSMIQAINPQVTLKTSPTIHPEFVFSVLKPAFA
jgi:hypothetical protein